MKNFIKEEPNPCFHPSLRNVEDNSNVMGKSAPTNRKMIIGIFNSQRLPDMLLFGWVNRALVPYFSDNISWNTLVILNVRNIWEHSMEYWQSHITLLWIMLCTPKPRDPLSYNLPSLSSPLSNTNLQNRRSDNTKSQAETLVMLKSSHLDYIAPFDHGGLC